MEMDSYGGTDQPARAGARGSSLSISPDVVGELIGTPSINEKYIWRVN
jgi:hypothetical protein